MSNDPPGWDGYNVRSDRIQVVRRYDADNEEQWVIVPHDDRPAVTLCPCCNLRMKTARAAKLVCNLVYPLPD